MGDTINYGRLFSREPLGVVSLRFWNRTFPNKTRAKIQKERLQVRTAMRYLPNGAPNVAANNRNLNVHITNNWTNQHIGIGNHNNAPNNVGNRGVNTNS